MCSRHAPENGADSEPVNTFDRSCDYCGRVQYHAPLHPISMSGTTSWECDACWERTQERYEREVA